MRPASAATIEKESGSLSHGKLSRSILLALAFLSLSLIILTLSGAYLLWQQWAAEIAVQRLSEYGPGLVDTFQSQIQNSRALLLNLAANDSVSGQLDKESHPEKPAPVFSPAKTYLQEALQSQTWFEHLFLVDPTGLVLTATQDDLDAQIFAGKWLEVLSTSPTTFAVNSSDLAANQSQQEQLVVLSSVPYRSPSGSVEAFLVGTYNNNFLKSIFKAARLDPAAEAYLVTASGDWYQVDPQQNLEKMTPTVAQTQKLQTALKSGNIILPKIASPFNLPEIQAAYQLEELELTVWIEQPLRHIMPPWKDLPQLTIAALTGILLLFLLILLIPHLQLRPLRQMARSFTLFADGYWEERVNSHRSDELGTIASGFNQMADEVQQLSRRIDAQIADHNDKTLGLAKITQLAASAPDLDEMIRPILLLTLKHFGYAYAAYYQVIQDSDGSTSAIFRYGAGTDEVEKEFIESKITLGTESTNESPLSRAIQLNRPQTGSKYKSDGLNPDNTNQVFEAAIPISINGQAFGCIRVFSITSLHPMLTQPNESTGMPNRQAVLPGSSQPTLPRSTPFSTVKIAELQVVANQFSLALRGLQVSGTSLFSNLPGSEAVSSVFQAGSLIAQAETADQVYATLGSLLQKQRFASAVLVAEEESFQVVQKWPGNDLSQGQIVRQLPGKNLLPLSRRAVSSYIKSPVPVIANDIRSANLPQALLDIPRQMGCNTAAIIPVLRNELVTAILVLGKTTDSQSTLPTGKNAETPFTQELLQPYSYLIETVTTSIEKIRAQEEIRKRLVELQTLWNISQATLVNTDISSICQVIHQQAENVMGRLNSFAVMLFDKHSGTIHAPYMVEDGKNLEIEPFPLGEGLSTVVLRTGKPLLIVEDTERKVKELGAKTVGAVAKSWLGVPLQYAGEVFGLIIAQDIYREHRFSMEDQRLLSTIASQVAMVVRNIRLMETTRRQARFEKVLNEITGKIRRATSIDDILQTSATELANALNARRAHIEIDVSAKPPNGNGKKNHQEHHS